MAYSDGDLVLCKVIEVGKTSVSVILEEDNKTDGTIPISEIAPGRIRNLRDYVVPNKRIVCKVLRANPSGSLLLSLRRVSLKEMKEVLDEHKKESAALKLLEVAVGDAEQGKKEYQRITSSEGKKLQHIFSQSLSDPSTLQKYLPKESIQRLTKILSEKKEKEKEVKKFVVLKSKKPAGLNDIKSAFSKCSCEVTYLAGGKYSLTLKTSDYKEGNNKLMEEISHVEKFAKEKGMEIQVMEK